jgi:hypothetical protein
MQRSVIYRRMVKIKRDLNGLMGMVEMEWAVDRILEKIDNFDKKMPFHFKLHEFKGDNLLGFCQPVNL